MWKSSKCIVALKWTDHLENPHHISITLSPSYLLLHCLKSDRYNTTNLQRAKNNKKQKLSFLSQPLWNHSTSELMRPSGLWSRLERPEGAPITLVTCQFTITDSSSMSSVRQAHKEHLRTPNTLINLSAEALEQTRPGRKSEATYRKIEFYSVL